MPSVPPMGPGAMMLDVMPRGPSSMAAAAERASMPALATLTWDWRGVPV